MLDGSSAEKCSGKEESCWDSNCASLDHLNQMSCFAAGKFAGGDPAACLLNDASGVDAASCNRPRRCSIHAHASTNAHISKALRRCDVTCRSTETFMKGTHASGVGMGGCKHAQRIKPTLTDRRGSVHLQPLTESTGQNLTAHQGEAWQTRVPDDVPC